MKTVELFCGTKSFSKVAEKLRHETWTSDNDASFEPDYCVDILDFDHKKAPYYPDIIWASPPCESFSVGSIGKHWNKDHTPKSERAVHGLAILDRTIDVIEMSKPRYWFIENPRGKMRKVIDNMLADRLGKYKRETICYCRYGDTRMKPTDIWTNCFEWKPENRMCHNGNPDHEAAPRGSKTGTQGIKDYKNRSVIPPALFEDIFSQLGQ